MVAGFVAGWTKQQDYDYAFRMGIAAGSASAFSELLATRQEIEQAFTRPYKNKWMVIGYK